MKRAHAAGVGPSIALEQPLVVLGRRHDPEVGAVAEREDRHLGAVQSFLQQEFRSGVAESALDEDGSDRVDGVLGGFRDDHALARGQAVGLDDRNRIEGGEMGDGLVRVREGRSRTGRDAVIEQELLAVDLRSFEPGGGLRGAERPDAFRGEGVDQAVDQRILGPDRHERHALGLRQGDQAGDVGGRAVDVATLGLDPGAGVSRHDEDFTNPIGLRQRPGHRVLATPAADHHDGLCVRSHESPQTFANCSLGLSCSWTNFSDSNG